MERSVLAFTLVKLAGAIYLVVLGIRTIVQRHEHASTQDMSIANDSRPLRDSFVVGITNPKGAVFFSAVLPQFADRSSGHLPIQIILLGAVFVAIALICDSLWSLLASRARAWFTQSHRRLRIVDGIGGLTMIGLGVSVAFTGRPD
ncbi:hypothetical protein GCM10027569_86290 [Flindersiella endophytica]